MTDWCANALGALDDARAEILGAEGETLMVIVTVSTADLLGDRPVSFYGNIAPDALGPFLGHCAQRIADRDQREGTCPTSPR